MLARHAENMFWAGRHMERADDTARMLDVAFHAAVQSTRRDADSSSRRLLQVLRLEQIFDEYHDEIDPDLVARFLIQHPDNPGSICRCLESGRENVRTTRELVSTELWEAVNRAHLDVSNRVKSPTATGSPYQLIEAVREHCQTVAGVATQTMPRDDAWNFLNLGYMIERAVMTLRLVAACDALEQPGFEEWVAALRSSSSLDAFQRAARGSTDARDVVAFLLFNETHPRSVLFCLTRSEQYLERLGGTDARRRARRMLGRLRSELDFADLDEIIESGLFGFLIKLEGGVREVADAVAQEYFRQQAEPFLEAISVPPGIIAASGEIR